MRLLCLGKVGNLCRQSPNLRFIGNQKTPSENRSMRSLLIDDHYKGLIVVDMRERAFAYTVENAVEKGCRLCDRSLRHEIEDVFRNDARPSPAPRLGTESAKTVEYAVRRHHQPDNAFYLAEFPSGSLCNRKGLGVVLPLLHRCNNLDRSIFAQNDDAAVSD